MLRNYVAVQKSQAILETRDPGHIAAGSINCGILRLNLVIEVTEVETSSGKITALTYPASRGACFILDGYHLEAPEDGAAEKGSEKP